MIAPREPTQKTCDIYFVGVGGQGVLTIGDVILETAFSQGIPVSFYPTKGMAQRGGFVKAQLRLGRISAGAAIPERGADLVIATEVSEALQAVRYIRPGGEFILFAHVWQPTAVMLGKAPYPDLAQVLTVIRQATGEGGMVYCIQPGVLPVYDGSPLPDNIFALGVAVSRTILGRMIEPAQVEQVLQTRWKRGVERNLMAFRAGMAMPLETALASGEPG